MKLFVGVSKAVDKQTKNKDEPAYQKLYAMLPSLKKRSHSDHE